MFTRHTFITPKNSDQNSKYTLRNKKDKTVCE